MLPGTGPFDASRNVQSDRYDDSESTLPDLTHKDAFARLRDAADLADEAGFVSRAEVAELADARGSGPRTRKGVGVRVPSSAPMYFPSH